MERSELKEMIQELVLTEADKDKTGIKKAYYDIGDKLQAFAKLAKSKKDAELKKISVKMFKTFRELETYLDNEYPDWD